MDSRHWGIAPATYEQIPRPRGCPRVSLMLALSASLPAQYRFYMFIKDVQDSLHAPLGRCAATYTPNWQNTTTRKPDSLAGQMLIEGSLMLPVNREFLSQDHAKALYPHKKRTAKLCAASYLERSCSWKVYGNHHEHIQQCNRRAKRSRRH